MAYTSEGKCIFAIFLESEADLLAEVQGQFGEVTRDNAQVNFGDLAQLEQIGYYYTRTGETAALEKAVLVGVASVDGLIETGPNGLPMATPTVPGFLAQVLARTPLAGKPFVWTVTPLGGLVDGGPLHVMGMAGESGGT